MARYRVQRTAAPPAVVLARMYFVIHGLALLASVLLFAGVLGLVQAFTSGDRPVVAAEGPEEAAALRRGLTVVWGVMAANGLLSFVYLFGAGGARSRGAWTFRLVLLLLAPVTGFFSWAALGAAVGLGALALLGALWFTRSVRGWYGIGRAKTGLRSRLARRLVRGG